MIIRGFFQKVRGSWNPLNVLLPFTPGSSALAIGIITVQYRTYIKLRAQVIVIPRYEYDIVVITRVRGEAEYEC